MHVKMMTMTFLIMIAFGSVAANVAFAAPTNSSVSKTSKKMLDGKTVSKGGDVSGGGSVYEAEFKTILEDLISRLDDASMWGLGLYKDVSPSDLRVVFPQVKVVFVSRDLFVTIDGVKKQVDALNHPAQMFIKVDSRRWVPLDKRQRERLVLHEIYGLLDIEKNVYGQSEITLSLLYGIEGPKSPEEECPLQTMGTHEGDYCLWKLIDAQEQKIKGLQKVLLTFSVPHAKDDEETAAFRMKVKKFIKNQRATFKSVRDAQCRLQVVSEGNMAAYDGSLCELQIGDKVLQALSSLYREAKYTDPNLPKPAPIKPWNG